jgi:hypothetical protein
MAESFSEHNPERNQEETRKQPGSDPGVVMLEGTEG